MSFKEKSDVCLSSWERFLNSLATRGGNILLLALLWAGMGVLVWHILHHPEVNVEAKTVVLATFSGFTGALTAMLQGGQSRQRAADSAEGPKLKGTFEASVSSPPGGVP